MKSGRSRHLLHCRSASGRTPRMFDFFGRSRTFGIAAIIAVIFMSSTGSYQFVFQGFAWVKMISQFSKTEAPLQVLIKTFDGKHPCSICKKISRTHSKDQAPQISPAQKFDPAFISAEGVLTVPDFARRSFFITSQSLILRGIRPPTPPPRSSFRT